VSGHDRLPLQEDADMEDTTSGLCEVCRQISVETIIESSDGRWPYRLCLSCAHRLITLSLRPLEWFHLAVLHGPHEHYLHDDFYSEEGEALQPKDRVVEPEKWPLPTIAQNDLAILIDYAVVRFYLSENDAILDKVRQHDATVLLDEIRRRLQILPSTEIEGNLYVICAYTLGHQAETLIRAAWQTYQREIFWTLSFASSYCLPLDEGFGRVVEGLAKFSPKEVRSACGVLQYFHTERTLDWLELNIQLPITNHWGSLAASSGFSWERAVKWLDLGRPLSLVALDALTRCLNYEISHPASPREFLGHIPKDSMLLQLETYLKKDPAPRIKQSIAKLVQRIEQGI
jgi:hypothetical protein